MKKLSIEIATAANNEQAALGLKPEVVYRPLVFDANYLMYYVLYDDNITFMIGGTGFTCRRTLENIQKLENAFEEKFASKIIEEGGI